MFRQLNRKSSCVGNSWCHAMFKIKYCHQIFDDAKVRFFLTVLFKEISENYHLPIKKVGFDSNHLHFNVDIGLRSKPEAAKILRGITGRKILRAFTEIKKKYFYGSGFWNPAYLLDNIGSDEEHVSDYIGCQKSPAINF
ncbi:MAG: IS200/IS605 family transposase [Candidatus Pacearchaeota archaeon]|nr:IS200/IS605 family transposase [Candidatus Pacearchaeota archaeon]